MTSNCMVTDCNKESSYKVFDGTFWIKCCKEHTEEFRQFAMENNKTYKAIVMVTENKEGKK